MASLNALLGNALREEFDMEGAFEFPEKRYELSTLLSYAMERHPLILKISKEAEAKDLVRGICKDIFGCKITRLKS